MRDSGNVYVEWVGGEALVLDRDSGELHYLNAPAAAVLALVQEHGYLRGVEEAVARFGLEPDAPELRALLDDLIASGIVTDPRRAGAAGPATEAPPPGEPRAPAG
ncbi:MAG TPA: HPr-rel-A system PqqD family peptide chaperone [Actinomycetota bacterium]|nr:HPr-rel-A system PqqD family peptide chaperone [Actinomycetota bacterium]